MKLTLPLIILINSATATVYDVEATNPAKLYLLEAHSWEKNHPGQEFPDFGQWMHQYEHAGDHFGSDLLKEAGKMLDCGRELNASHLIMMPPLGG